MSLALARLVVDMVILPVAFCFFYSRAPGDFTKLRFFGLFSIYDAFTVLLY
jgi:hypothetical protein